MKQYLSDHKILQVILCLIIFIVSLALIILGQKEIGYIGILKMMIGLAGILFLLGFYNSFYNK
ncbi:Uncharacterised protein [uncultured Ruminococcus sp.]|uniref:Uncharacterized protein n=1 Tax=Massiliimalia timonensis TaxID=1987501 RepID=A0A8J6TYN8_9FIRM|nr:hypothetical protein [Massiliimalia timonensis]MBC8610197.1 hypothetical protein [Massiliimalia timonensis]SCH04916.1 Uncharacterised protein [uncultured Ruminococcus sp.]SCH74837.1 Uncharacterised protein [uncultured Clostridium sp.]